MTKILVLGASGMLGFTAFTALQETMNYEVFGTIRNDALLAYFPEKLRDKVIPNVDILNNNHLFVVLNRIRPQVIINCIGIIKQRHEASDPLQILPVNALFPHQLMKLADLCNARVIHISTDCVFKGDKGNYSENDVADAIDLYGKSKYIGELIDNKNAITLRTSIIGHELNSNQSLIDWFLTQTNSVKGYKRAFFSGLPTIELINIIKQYVIPNSNLYGVFHVSSAKIDKFSLLTLVKESYQKNIEIVEDEEFKIDRSLNSSKFFAYTGYNPPSWPNLIMKMKEHYSLYQDSYQK